MIDLRKIVFAWLTFIVLLGTEYSFVHNTYLDTSDPTIAHLPHPLGETRYFANKKNFLNVYFIKFAWGWTTASFLLLWATSPTNFKARRRLLQWGIETLSWIVFTTWFFGPSLLDRVLVSSGGECIVHNPDGELISVPVEFCYLKSPVSHQTHPHLFVNSLVETWADWQAVPRLRKGHDVSGHIFLLTMSILFLSDQLRPSFAQPRGWSSLHSLAVALCLLLTLTWFVASYTTCVYFHTPQEKVTGYCAYLVSRFPKILRYY